jgi:hypothetical protein
MTAPTLQAHVHLMETLPEELSLLYRSDINRLLVHLEKQGLSWPQLVPGNSAPGTRPLALEQAINEGIGHHGLHPGVRTAVNRIFGFTIQGKSEIFRRSPVLQQHTDLMAALPAGLSAPYRSDINRLLVHLEKQDLSWSQLVPANSGPGARPPGLEKAVNEGIRYHGLHSTTRVAVNRAFGFTIKSGSRPITLPPTLQAHIDLMKSLPEELIQQYRSHINRLLVHLEDEHLSWPQLVPAGSSQGARPLALEQVINEGIRHHGLHPGVRMAVNRAFGFSLQSRVRKVRFTPTLQSHVDVMKALPKGLTPQRRSDINRLLVHLEERGLTWEQLVPIGYGAGARPLALEQAINEGIRHGSLPSAMRAAINQAFGFTILAESKRALHGAK